MKILCTADWHIGKKLDGFSRLEEQQQILNEIINISLQEQADAVIIAGDCFDNQSPTPEMTKLFVNSLAQLSRGGECLVLVIAGNHDNPFFLSSSEAFASQLGVVILGNPLQTPSLEENQSLWKVTYKNHGVLEIFFKKNKKTVRFLLSPYANSVRLRRDLGTNDIDQKAWEILCNEWQKNISQEEDVSNILVTHSYLLPEKLDLITQDPIEDSEERSIVGTLGAISLEKLPDGIDYVIAGHIHRPQYLPSTKTKAFYTGSPLIYSLSESGQQKSVLMIELAKKNKEYTIPLQKIKDVKQIIFDDMDQIAKILDQEKDNYLILIWEGDTYFTAEQHQYIRTLHPFILRLEARPKIVKEHQNFSFETIHEQSIQNLFTEYFCSKHSDQEPPKDLLDVFTECLGEEESTQIYQKKQGFSPKSLLIKGIYSYKNETFIDFTRFQTNQFFGVFGDTGSGKSAIIESMIIALFYEVERFGTFGSRGKGVFSNAYGMMNLESNESLIEFIFEVYSDKGLEEYKCRVSGSRSKKNHMEVRSTREVLIYDQGDWIPSQNTKGEEILGITYSDFRKTIVLQQRDFLGFISDSPKNSSETLMRLFHLERFNLSNQVKSLETITNKNYNDLAKDLEYMVDINQEQLEKFQNLEQESILIASNLKDELERYNEKLSELRRQHMQKQKFLACEQKYQQLQIQLPNYQQAQEKQLILPLIQQENIINETTSKSQKFQNEKLVLEKKQSELETNLKQITQQKDETKSNVEKLQNQIALTQQEWTSLLQSSIPEKYQQFNYKTQEYQKVLVKIADLQNDIESQYQKIQHKNSIIQEMQHLQEQEKKLVELSGLKLAVQHLKKDCACPLCGSFEHPMPYKIDSDDELRDIQQQIKNFQNELTAIARYEGQIESQKNEQKSQENLKNQLLQGYSSYEELLQEFSKIQNEHTEQQEQTKTLKHQLDYLQKEIQKWNDQHQELLSDSQKIQSDIDKNNKDIEFLMEKIHENQTRLIAAQQEFQNLFVTHQLTEDSYKQKLLYPDIEMSNIYNFFTQLTQVETEYNTYKNTNIDIDPLQLQEIENKYQELENQYTTHQQQLGVYRKQITDISNTIEKKQKTEQLFTKTAIRKENLQILNRLFVGAGFVDFIAQKYLTKLCDTANQRFLRFTRNQFELSAPEQIDKDKGRIMVIDRLSGGNPRDMSTLSGGQSFQASLALALALSDESGAGHRFFFIDEGFGTLDQDSLLIILQNLRELSSLEGRVVGIISHVSLMKDEVSAYLQVSLDKNQGTVVSIHD